MRVKDFLLLCSVATLSQWAMAEVRTFDAQEVERPAIAPASKHSSVNNKQTGTTQNHNASPTKSASTGQNSGESSGSITGSPGSPQALGMVHGILDFCSQIDPANKASYQQQWASATNGDSATQLASIEAEAAFQQSYNNVIAMLGKTPHSAAVQGCSDGALEWNGGTPTTGNSAGGNSGGNSSGGNSSDGSSSDGKHRTTTGRTTARERP